MKTLIQNTQLAIEADEKLIAQMKAQSADLRKRIKITLEYAKK